MRKFALVALMMVAGYAQADSCDALQGKYVEQDKELASIKAAGIGDNSAPRESNRQLQAGNVLAKKQLLLTTMSLQKCPLPKSFETSFIVSALSCATETMRGYNSDAAKEACDRSKWRPDLPAAQ